jgi:crotonobetainyl-CoA:carnitine CoA-transferase CaiB-like acyl-CoA transferase
MNRPLAGIRVVDFTHVLAGPACAYYLGLLGANVIKVERPGRGDAMRHRGGTDKERARRGMSTAYLTQGAGKRSVEGDLETAEGREAMDTLLGSADVLVENHRPSTLSRLGLDWVRLQRLNPKLIHCAITGYGRGGPLADAPAYDVNIQAASGLMSVTGTAETGPLRAGAPVVDYSVALAAALAVMTALFERTQTGRGQFVDVSMFETALTLMGSMVTDHLVTGHEPKPRGNAANSRSPSAGTFPCREGLLSLGVNETAQFQALARELGQEAWLTDPAFQTAEARDRNAEELGRCIGAALATASAQEWEQRLLAVGVPAARVRTLPEAVRAPEIAARGFLHDPGEGRPVAPGLPFRYGDANAYDPLRPVERLGAATPTDGLWSNLWDQ